KNNNKEISVKIRANPRLRFPRFRRRVPPLRRCLSLRSDAPTRALIGSSVATAADLAITPRSFRPARLLPASTLRRPLRPHGAPMLPHLRAGDRPPRAGMEQTPPASLPPRFPRPCSLPTGRPPSRRERRLQACP